MGYFSSTHEISVVFQGHARWDLRPGLHRASPVRQAATVTTSCHLPAFFAPMELPHRDPMAPANQIAEASYGL